jgi:hypothetical protein
MVSPVIFASRKSAGVVILRLLRPCTIVTSSPALRDFYVARARAGCARDRRRWNLAVFGRDRPVRPERLDLRYSPIHGSNG